MKYAAALALPLAGLSIAQTSKVPYIIQVQTGFSYGCQDALKLGMSLSEDALVFNMNQFYADLNGYKKAPRVADYGVCVMQMNFQLQEGWRFRFTNATYSGHASASEGAYIPHLLTTTYMQYMRTNHTPKGEVISRQIRALELADYIAETNFGKDAAYDSSFEVTAESSFAPQWMPCVTPTYDGNTEFKFMMQTHVGFTRPDDDRTYTLGQASIGSPTAGLKLRIGLEYEKCDPAALPVDSWGTRVSNGEILPPSNSTETKIPQ